jgi:hypothetical protein
MSDRDYPLVFRSENKIKRIIKRVSSFFLGLSWYHHGDRRISANSRIVFQLNLCVFGYYFMFNPHMIGKGKF